MLCIKIAGRQRARCDYADESNYKKAILQSQRSGIKQCSSHLDLAHSSSAVRKLAIAHYREVVEQCNLLEAARESLLEVVCVESHPHCFPRDQLSSDKHAKRLTIKHSWVHKPSDVSAPALNCASSALHASCDSTFSFLLRALSIPMPGQRSALA